VESLNDTSCTVDLPNLTGSGIVTVELAPIVGSPNLYVSEEFYTFTPEPSSLLLFGSGALGVAGVLRRKLML
jgi:PEP-CTERM motif